MMNDLKLDDFLIELDDATAEILLQKMTQLQTNNQAVREQIAESVANRCHTAREFFGHLIQSN
jgi:polysaccharide pyruvyl transferase WcaK-like protein